MDIETTKPTVTIRPRGRFAFDPRNQMDARELLMELSSDKLDLALELPNPNQFSAQNALETLGIYITGVISATMMPLVVTDIYNGTKRFLVKRFEKRPQANPTYVTIYGPDNTPIKSVLAKSADNIKDMPPPKPHY
ncbi:hypothetical protein [Mycolicibacterium frederiksbergense]|uniref:hypothetical protein n=1 Tax=Mycolicibacterium frederiksbergense TaxID=117567 RepID=UPI00265B9CE3|nr:hypothetical protein [Mycolicibacterium frederiksbergense]MDO0975168.1 hypothetical protein [Mycolicibacterium frederiksbergense]